MTRLKRDRVALLVSIALAGSVGCGGGTTLTPCYTCGNAVSPTQTSSSSLTVSTPTTVQGQNVTFTTTVNPSAAIGLVYLYDLTGQPYMVSGPTLFGGVATAVVNDLAVGTHLIYAQYTGDSTYEESASTPVVIAVAAAGANCGLDGATYALTSGSATQNGVSYAASVANQSAVCVTGPGTTLTLNNPTVTATFNSSAAEDDINGLGAAVLAYSTGAGSVGTINIAGGSVATNGIGVDAIFASGPGSAVTATGTTLTTIEYIDPQVSNSPYYASDHVVGVGRGGSVVLNNVNASNSPLSSWLLALYGDGSSINITDGTMTAGGGSAVYPFGQIAEVEGQSSLSFSGTAVSASGDTGFVFANSTTGESGAGSGSLSMTGGSLAVSGTFEPTAILVAGSTTLPGARGTISLNGTAIAPMPLSPGFSPTILTVGQNGTAVLSATGQTLPGDLDCNSCASLTVSLQAKSSWTGKTSGTVILTLDGSSSWTLTGNSTAGTFSDSAGIVGGNVVNVTGNGFNVTYDAAKSPALGGKTYQLVGGGLLMPGATQ